MLGRIINSSKKVIKKGKKAFLTGLAGLTLLYVSGCEGTFKVRTIWEGKNIIERKEINEEFKIEEVKKKEYKIDNLFIEKNRLKFNVKENFCCEKYIFSAERIKKILLIKEYDIYIRNIVESQEYFKRYGDLYEENVSLRNWTTNKPGIFFEMNIGRTTIRQEAKAELTGRIKEKIFEEGRWEINSPPIKEGTISTNNAKNLKVYCESKDVSFQKDNLASNLEEIIFTDNEGNVEIILLPFKYWDFNKDSLVNKIREYEEIKCVKDTFKQGVLKKIIDSIKKQAGLISISTEGVDTQDIKVINDYKKVPINGFYIESEKIYSVLKEFINQEINSKIKETVLIVQDKNSHVEIPDVKIEMNIEGAPTTKRDLADDYFTGKILEWAIGQIKTYNGGKFSQYTDKQGIIRFNVYVPSKFKFETKHSKYHSFEKSTDFKEDNLEKTVRLIDIGEKLRVEQEEKRGGDLIEK